MLMRISVSIIAAFVVSHSLYAQQPDSNKDWARDLLRQGQMMRQSQEGRQIQIEGTIEGVTPQGLIVAATVEGMNQRLHIPIATNTKVEVSGTIPPQALHTGEVVQFEAELKEGQIVDKVGELVLLGTANAKAEEGLFPTGDTQHEESTVGEEKPQKSTKPATKNTKKPASPSGPHLIVGRITTPRGATGKYIVLAGRKRLSFQLDEQATVTVKSSDASLAAAGDKITADVTIIPGRTPQSTQIYARNVSIELSERTVPATKKAPATGTKHSEKHSKKEHGLPAPAADR